MNRPIRAAIRAGWLLRWKQALEFVASQQGARQFERLRNWSPMLRPFSSAATLLEWLTGDTDNRGLDDVSATPSPLPFFIIALGRVEP